MYFTHEAELDLPCLPRAARRVHIVPALSTASLLSIGQLCDAGCCVTFDAASMTVHFNDRVLLTGARTPSTGLWHLSLSFTPATALPAQSPAPPPSSYSAVTSATPAELVAFAHATLFSPALSTLRVALARGYLTHFPGLTNQTPATLLCNGQGPPRPNTQEPAVHQAAPGAPPAHVCSYPRLLWQ
jgi:hypothetical protein